MARAHTRPPVTVTASPLVAPPPRRRLRRLSLYLLLAAFLVLGGSGVVRYVETFWRYRGFAPPKQVHAVRVAGTSGTHLRVVGTGTLVNLTLKPASLGGRAVPVIVYLPPGYRTSGAHYPVLYLLHGFPGSPQQFIDVADLVPVADELIAKGAIEPMICVMPAGSTNFFVDEEWSNTVQPHNNWETYISRDLVSAVDRRYRAKDAGSQRGIAGLSEGGYASINISFHHVGEFDLVEGWSAYFTADTKSAIFGHNAKLIAYNSPTQFLASVAPALRKAHTYIWLYNGSAETRSGAERFATQLAAAHVASSWRVVSGRHNWALWRKELPNALVTASEYFQHGPPTR